MKPYIIGTLICVIITLNLTAQIPAQINIGKENKKTTYQQNGKCLTQEELAEVLKCYPASDREYQVSSAIDKIGMAFVVPGVVLGGIGGLLNVSHVLRFMGDMAYYGDDPDQASKYRKYANITALSGVGLIAAGCTFHFISISLQKKSVRIYNGINPAGKIENGKLYFGFTRSGFGVQLRF
jgi:hypothetical protein